MVRVLKILSAITFLICSFTVEATAAPRLSLEVHPNFGTVDDFFILSVTLADGPEDATAPLLTGGGDFRLSLLGPASSLQIANGSISRRVSYNYELSPKQEGILTTPGAEVTIDGQKLTAAPLQVTIRGARASTPPEEGQPENADYFMRQKLSPSDSAYVGQQLTHTLEIYTRTTLIDPQLQELTFPGFRSEPIGEQENARRYLNGVPYTVSVLRRALFPQTSGEIQIAPRELKTKVRSRATGAGAPFGFGGMDPFDPNFVDNFFNRGTLRGVTLRSNPLTLRVKPLPTIPANFPLLGLDLPPVGRTAVRVSYDPVDISYGDTKTVNATISSAGNIQGVKSLGLKGGGAVKLYAESPETKTTFQGDLLWTTKSFKLSLVPLATSAAELPSIALGYFDPDDGQYKVASSEVIKFAVLGTPAATQDPAVGSAAPLPPQPAAEQQLPNPSAPPTSTPAPRYEEPTAIEGLLTRVSIPLALLFLAAALLLAGAVSLGLYLRGRGAPRREIMRELSAAQTPQVLATALQAALRQRYPALSEQFSREELRGVVKNRQLLFQIETLFDTLDSTLFGGAQSPLSELKSQAVTLLEGL